MTSPVQAVCVGCAYFNPNAMTGKCAKGHGALYRLQLGSKGKCLSRKPAAAPSDSAPQKLETSQ